MSNSPSQNSPPSTLPWHSTKGKRACAACSRKKTKCDMTLPTCSLCQRTETSCVYPLRRKPRAPRASRSDTTSQDANLKYRRPRQDGLFPPGPGCFLTRTTDGCCHMISDTTIASPHQPALTVDADNGLVSPAINQLVSEPPLNNMSNDTDASYRFPHFWLNPLEAFSPESWDPNFTFGLPFFDLNFQLPLPQTNQRSDVPGSHLAYYNSLHDDSVTHHTGHQQFTPPLTDFLTFHAPQPQNVSDILEQDSFEGLPTSLLDDLVDLWFDRVQSFLPLLHRPRFKSQFATDSGGNSSTYHDLGWEVALLLNAMYALAARFSDAPYFADTPCQHRGEQFAQRAKAIYEASLSQLKAPTLVYLQGLITLAFYLYATEPDSQGWLLIGTCSRLAYALELDKLDEDSEAVQSQMGLPHEWSMQEERRRAWWCIWELDAFAAAIACRRPTIDKKNMQVMLSVSDEAWFSDTPVESAIIDPRPTHAWCTLENSQNQDPRSWYLVANFLLLSAHDLLHTKASLRQEVDQLEAALTCFAMLLPASLDVRPSLSFTELTYRRSNWVVSTHIMLQGAFIFCRFINARAASTPLSNSSNRLLAPLAAGSQFQVRTADYRTNTEQVFAAVRSWNPTYIGFHNPFIACLVVGPAAINIRVALDSRKEDAASSSSLTGLESDILILTLKRVARFWNFGSILLDLIRKVYGDHTRNA